MLEWRGAVSVMQRSPAITWGDRASFTPQTQTHRQLSRISQWRRIFQDLHGTSSRRWVLALILSSWSETSLPWYCWFAVSKNFLSIFVLALGVPRWQSHCRSVTECLLLSKNWREIGNYWSSREMLNKWKFYAFISKLALIHNVLAMNLPTVVMYLFKILSPDGASTVYS